MRTAALGPIFRPLIRCSALSNLLRQSLIIPIRLASSKPKRHLPLPDSARPFPNAPAVSKYKKRAIKSSKPVERPPPASPDIPTPPVIPVKSAKGYFPDFVQQGPDSFLTYYCKRFSLGQLEEKCIQVTVKSKKKSKPHRTVTKWTTHYTLPAHASFQNQSLPQISVSSTFETRSLSRARARELLIAHLLHIVDPLLVQEFIDFATPAKRKIQTMIDTPSQISIPNALLLEAQTLFRELESAKAFEPTVSKDLSNEFESAAGVGRKKHVSLLSHSAHGRTDPANLAPPQSLDHSKELPMYKYYSTVMAAIDNHPVTIISASTGAGKTTQLPQFILAHYAMQKSSVQSLSRGIMFKSGFKNPSSQGKSVLDHAASLLPPPNVIVTQPRRIAAISVAQRVARERGETMGRDSAIGYTVRFNSVAPKSDPADGHVVFCTSGILLKRLQDDPNLHSVTHIILDEVHERDLNTDLLLIIVRQLLQRRPDLKVILMSATADTTLFAKYFSKVNPSIVGKPSFPSFQTPPPPKPSTPPIITVPGRTFPVKQHHLHEVLQLIKPILPPTRFLPPTQRYVQNELYYDPSRSSNMNQYTNPGSSSGDVFPIDLYESLLTHIMQNRGEGAILVFLPGWQEISALMNQLKDDRFQVGFGDDSRCKLYALHSSVSGAGQEEVFVRPREGVRKIILATNIAETSVTINDVVYVIDSGKIRINTYDPSTRLSSLNCVFAAQSNLKQRSGRAGRCQPGEYYSLLSHAHHTSLPYTIPPELLRVDLQSTALKIKALNLAPFTADVLALAPQPPSPESTLKALRDLHTLGALVTTKPHYRGGKSGESEHLTPLGKSLVQIPMDPWLAKLMVLAAAFKVLDPVLTAACVLESGSRGVHAIHPDEREQARAWIMNTFVCGREESYGSDLLAMVTAYWDWKRAMASGVNRREFCDRNYLNHTGLMNVDRTKDQVVKALKDLKIIEGGETRSGEVGLFGGAEANVLSRDTGLVRALISASLFPNVAEAREKNTYSTTIDGKLKLTGSTINSYSSLQMVENARLNSGTTVATQENPRVLKPDEPEQDEDDTPSDDSPTDLQVPITPPRFLSYHEKQMLEGAVWLRTTTIATPMGLLLFSSFGEHESRINWLQDHTTGKWVALLGGWMRVEFADEESKVVVELVRKWMDLYLEWVVGGGEKVKTREEQRLAGELVRFVAKLLK
ncbi:hypothetical protein HDU98_006134 [Podochytrium sp. JEL0797]|nr:hypothetical protein HDU98_006134 [Podochytrium sp. JEL0797]